MLYKWDKIKSDGPKARDSLSLVNVSQFTTNLSSSKIGDSIIMFGGCGSGKDRSFNDVNKYDLDKKQW